MLWFFIYIHFISHITDSEFYCEKHAVTEEKTTGLYSGNPEQN